MSENELIKKSDNEEKNEEFDFSDFIFDVACGNCGEMIFSLPYKLDTVHSMKCHGCGETNIIEVDEKGGIGHMLKTELDKLMEQFTEELNHKIFFCDGFTKYIESGQIAGRCKNSGTIDAGDFILKKIERNGLKAVYTVACKNNGDVDKNCIQSSHRTEITNLKNYGRN